MSESKPRRSRVPEAPGPVSGYRQSRRGSTAAKSAKKAERKYKVATAATRGWRGFKNFVLVILQGIALVVAVVLVLLLAANGVNTFARWNAKRIAEKSTIAGEQLASDKENIVVVGVEGERAVGYLALRVDQKRAQVFGIAIPDGAFVDIPGRGFDRIGEAYGSGTDVVLATISNYFTVTFNSYIVVPSATYRQAMTAQSVTGLTRAISDTNLTPTEVSALTKSMAAVEQKNVALVPMPVKPIKLGDQTYYEPEREEITDLLKTWWGVDASKGERMTRVIVYNGAGTPGIAGKAAQQLIRSGFRVVDTKNADKFGYKTTQIVVRRGDSKQGDAVMGALGVGTVKVDLSDADVTDVIVIIGKDYRPATAQEERK